MPFDPQADLTSSAEATPECRRSRGRLPQESLASDLGPVLDLSANGMRVQCAKVPKGPVPVRLMGYSESLTLQAEVAWSKRRGFRKHEVGLRFVCVDPATAERLTRMSTNNRMRRVMPDQGQAA